LTEQVNLTDLLNEAIREGEGETDAEAPEEINFVLETSREHRFVPFVGTRLLDEFVPPR